MPGFIKVRVVKPLFFTTPTRRNHRLGTARQYGVHDFPAVESFIRKDICRINAGDKRKRNNTVSGCSSGNNGAHRHSVGIDR